MRNFRFEKHYFSSPSSCELVLRGDSKSDALRRHFVQCIEDEAYPVLSDLYFTRLSLKGVDATDLEAKRSFLRFVDFSGALLVGSSFSGSYLYRVNFEGAKLNRACFCGAVVDNCYFDGADLENVCCWGTVFHGRGETLWPF